MALLSVLLGFTGILWQWRAAESERERAEAGGLSALRNAYAADIRAAQRALEDDDYSDAAMSIAVSRDSR